MISYDPTLNSAYAETPVQEWPSERQKRALADLEVWQDDAKLCDAAAMPDDWCNGLLERARAEVLLPRDALMLEEGYARLWLRFRPGREHRLPSVMGVPAPDTRIQDASRYLCRLLDVARADQRKVRRAEIERRMATMRQDHAEEIRAAIPELVDGLAPYVLAALVEELRRRIRPTVTMAGTYSYPEPLDRFAWLVDADALEEKAERELDADLERRELADWQG